MSSCSTTPEFKWYEERLNNNEITQGDILFNCPVVLMKASDTPPFFVGGHTNVPKVIVMTQACDLARGGKVEDVAVCPVGPLTKTIEDMILHDHKIENQNRETNGQDRLPEIDFQNLTGPQKKKKKRFLDELLKGNYLDYYVLNKHESQNDPNLNMEYQVVYLRKTFYVPMDVLNKVHLQKPGRKIQLLPPYREHLAQAYARNFMRIGLPLDLRIDVSEV